MNTRNGSDVTATIAGIESTAKKTSGVSMAIRTVLAGHRHEPAHQSQDRGLPRVRGVHANEAHHAIGELLDLFADNPSSGTG